MQLRKTSDALIWDWPVRAFHWLLVACVAGAWATHYGGLQWFDWHRRLGYATLVLVTFRVAWGFVGPRHSRFVSFVRGPAAVMAYLRAGVWAQGPGHNALGGWSVLAFLAVLLLQAASGLFANDAIANAGPFYGWVSPSTSDRLTSIHAFNSNVLLVLISVHLVAIAVFDLWARRGLVRAMVTGRKPGATAGIERSRGALALVIVALLAAALALAIRAAPEATLTVYF
jgi:cytochrome b